MAPYSMDLRTRVLADCDAGVAAKEVAAKFRVSRWVNRLLQRTGARVRDPRYVVSNRDHLSRKEVQRVRAFQIPSRCGSARSVPQGSTPAPRRISAL